MNGRLAWKAIGVVVVLSFTSFGTVRARQVWDEHQAKSQYSVARSAAHAAVRQARKAGVLDSELASVRRMLARLDGKRAPQTTPLWSDEAAFYDRNSRAYQSVAKRAATVQRKATREARSMASSRLATVRDDIAKVSALDLDTATAKMTLLHQKSLFDRSSRLRQYTAVAAELRLQDVMLASIIAVQGRYVNGVLAAAKNSQAIVLQNAQAEVSTAGGRLALLGLFTSRTARYQSQLQQDLAAIQSASDAHAAAVKEWHVHTDLQTLQADYTKTVPNQLILVSTENQDVTMYQSGEVIDSSPVTTGGPELPTDHGIFHIYFKASPFTFHSPWPPDSPYYYNPTPVQFWMPFDGGEGLHDASWRSNFGPGSNTAPTDLGTGNYILGTHGCVNLPFTTAQFIWNWAPAGTTVVVI